MIAAVRLNLIGEEIRDLEELFSDYEGAFLMKGSVYGQTDGVYYCIDI
jgi:hypothetical protein